jgi:hypothetical protein
MFKWLIRKRIAAFEREFDYDLAYARQVLQADTRAFLTLSRMLGMSSYRRDVPADVSYAVKLTGTLAEDCGPCTQLMVTMALGQGVAAGTLAAILAGDTDRMGEPVALGVRFARAVLAHDPAARAGLARVRADGLAALPHAQVRARSRPGVPPHRGCR